MKKLLVTLMLVASSSAFAGGHGGGHGSYRGHGGYHSGSIGWGWVAPAVITGAVIYTVTRPPVTAVPTPQPAVPYGYHYEQILDANCNCYRMVLVQN